MIKTSGKCGFAPVIACFIPLVALCSGFWRGGGDAAEVSAAFLAYTNDTARVVSVAEDGRDWPSALPFVVPVKGDAVRFAAAIEAGEAAFPVSVRDALKASHACGPYRQWLLRRSLAEAAVPASADAVGRAGAVETAYFSAAVHPAVFTNADETVLKRVASSVTLQTLPPIACVWAIYGEYARGPIRRAVPGHDYPGVLPEETVATPLGSAIVLRAPERRRRFRFRAAANAGGRPVEYRWQTVRGHAAVSAWSGTRGLSPASGFAEITLDWRSLDRRADVIVCARTVGGVWGPPAILSFSRPADETRVWNSHGEIESIRYPGWTDVYELDWKGVVTGFSRTRAEWFGRERFAFADERLYATWPDGSPRRSARVTYRRTETGVLTYDVSTESVSHPRGKPVSHDRGEFTVAAPRDERATHGKPSGAH